MWPRLVGFALAVAAVVLAFFRIKSSYVEEGYAKAVDRRDKLAEMVQNDVARKDKAIDKRTKAVITKVKATAASRLEKNNGRAANGFLSRVKKPWRVRDK